MAASRFLPKQQFSSQWNVPSYPQHTHSQRKSPLPDCLLRAECLEGSNGSGGEKYCPSQQSHFSCAKLLFSVFFQELETCSRMHIMVSTGEWQPFLQKEFLYGTHHLPSKRKALLISEVCWCQQVSRKKQVKRKVSNFLPRKMFPTGVCKASPMDAVLGADPSSHGNPVQAAWHWPLFRINFGLSMGPDGVSTSSNDTAKVLFLLFFHLFLLVCRLPKNVPGELWVSVWWIPACWEICLVLLPSVTSQSRDSPIYIYHLLKTSVLELQQPLYLVFFSCIIPGDLWCSMQFNYICKEK